MSIICKLFHNLWQISSFLVLNSMQKYGRSHLNSNPKRMHQQLKNGHIFGWNEPLLKLDLEDQGQLYFNYFADTSKIWGRYLLFLDLIRDRYVCTVPPEQEVVTDETINQKLYNSAETFLSSIYKVKVNCVPVTLLIL